MGSLTESAFTKRIEDGCTACGAKKLAIRAYVVGAFPLLGGEPFGAVKWAYKGETFVDGVFEIRCASCKHDLFADAMCPRCHAPDALAKALESENAHTVPNACPTCGGDAVAYRAFVPVTVIHEGKRVDKARTSCELTDPGFHGIRALCEGCGSFGAHGSSCPLCDAPGPIRDQPR